MLVGLIRLNHFCLLFNWRVFFNSYISLFLFKYLKEKGYWQKSFGSSLGFFFFNKLLFFKVLSKFILKTNIVFFFRLALKGLGFSIISLGSYILKFYFGLNHYIYLLKPSIVFLKKRRKSFLFISLFKTYILILYSQIFFLKRLVSYYKGIKSKGFKKYSRIRFLKKKNSVLN